MSVRRMIVIEVLATHNGFMTQKQLYDECCKREEFLAIDTGTGEAHKPWYATDFDVLLRRMEEDGLICRVLNCYHRLVVVLLQKGLDWYQMWTEKRVVKRKLLRRLRNHVYYALRHGFFNERHRDRAREMLEQLRELKVDLRRIFVQWFAIAHYWSRQYGADPRFDNVVRLLRQLVGEFYDDVEEIERRGRMKGEQKLEKLIGLEPEQAFMKPIGNCFICGAPIHRKEAQQDAELIKKYTGAETGVVCCSCYYHLKWIEEKLGGVIT